MRSACRDFGFWILDFGLGAAAPKGFFLFWILDSRFWIGRCRAKGIFGRFSEGFLLVGNYAGVG
jgi:hypothetical protein